MRTYKDETGRLHDLTRVTALLREVATAAQPGARTVLSRDELLSCIIAAWGEIPDDVLAALGAKP